MINHYKFLFNSNITLVVSFVFLLSSCSSMGSIKFWENDEIDLDEPMRLLNINEKKDPPVDSDKYKNEDGKFEKYFNENL